MDLNEKSALVQRVLEIVAGNDHVVVQQLVAQDLPLEFPDLEFEMVGMWQSEPVVRPKGA